MKFHLLLPFVLLLLLVTSCGDEPHRTEPNLVVSSEVFTTKIGSKEAYGVQMKLSSDSARDIQYVIELKVNEQVWLDTIVIGVPQKDTLESEVIFSESQVKPNDLVELNIKASSLGR